PFEKLVEELHPGRDLGQNPLFQVIFAVQNAPFGLLELPGLTVRAFARRQVSTRFDLEVHVWDREGALGAVFAYNRDLFDADTVDRLGAHWLTLLEVALGAPETAVRALPLMQEDERRAVVALGRGTRSEYPRAGTVHGVFAAQAARTPDAVAVVFGGERLRYAELHRRSNRLARHLAARGVTAGARVGLCLD